MYAELGFEVFPLMELGKAPRIASKDGGKGVKDATADPKKIAQWWTRFPNCNIGIHCSQFWVLDVDVKHNGPDALNMLVDKYGALPETLRQRSGSGGTHYLFNMPKGALIANSAGFYPGLDTRAEGGYIVAAPSKTEAGGEYAWENWGTKIADAPGWLVEMVKATKRSYTMPERSDTGRRDVDDASLAGALHNLGMTEDEVFAALQKRNNDPNRRNVPLPTNEIMKTVRSICSRDIRMPSSLRQALHETRLAQVKNLEVIKPNPLWVEGLVAGKDGGPKNILANSEAALSHSPLFCNSLAFNELSCEVHLTRNIVDPISGNTISNLTAGAVVNDQIVREMLAVAQRLITEVTFTEEIFGSGVQLVAHRNKFHPVQDYLNGLEWKGGKLIDTWLIDHLGVEDDPDGYARAIGRRWLISAVNRALKPGCIANSMLIIEGPQDCGKSRALRTLAGADYFKDSPLDFRSKDIFGALKGVWVYEFAEFDQYKGHDVARIKSLLSSQVDTYRPPYARSDVKQPRGVIFAGTVNPDTYLTDDTGAKRFWPVKVVRHTRKNPIDVDKLADARDQLWAEAVHEFYAGAPGFIDMPELINAHEKHAMERYDNDDVWAPLVHMYLDKMEGRKQLLTVDILQNACNVPIGRQTNKERDRVKKIMLRAGFEYKKRRELVEGAKKPIWTWAAK